MENAEDSWVAVGLLMTKTHIVVTGSNGSIDWLTLPSETGEGLEVHYFCDYVCTYALTPVTSAGYDTTIRYLLFNL